MNDLKNIIEDVNKSEIVSKKVIDKVIEIIGWEEWQDLHDDYNDVITTAGEVVITLRNLELENKQLKQQIEKMKNCDNCKNLLQCTNRRYKKMTSNKITMIRFPCCWEFAE